MFIIHFILLIMNYINKKRMKLPSFKIFKCRVLMSTECSEVQKYLPKTGTNALIKKNILFFNAYILLSRFC